MYLSAPCAISACRGQKTVSDPLELELWMLGFEPGSSGKATSAILCVWVHACTCGGQRTTCKSQLSYILWDPGSNCSSALLLSLSTGPSCQPTVANFTLKLEENFMVLFSVTTNQNHPNLFRNPNFVSESEDTRGPK